MGNSAGCLSAEDKSVQEKEAEEYMPLKTPDFPSIPDDVPSEEEWSSNSDRFDVNEPVQFPPKMPAQKSNNMPLSPIDRNGAGNIFEIFQFFHGKDMLGSAFKNNVTDEMREQSIHIEHDIAARSTANLFRASISASDINLQENGGEVAAYNDDISDDGDDLSESDEVIGHNIIALMNIGGSGEKSNPTKEQVESLKVLIEEKKGRASPTTGYNEDDILGPMPSFSLSPKNPLSSSSPIRSSRFSMSQSMGDDLLLSPIHRPTIKRRETKFLISQGLKNDMPLTQEVLDDLADDPTMWLLSESVTSNLKTTGDIARVMQHVESTINLIEGYIPNLGEMLKDEKSATSYITNVIQELLKRAQGEGLLQGVQQDWARWKGADLGSMAQKDIRKMVQAMAWTRNNIRAANVTDANDAKMASTGATDVKHTLKRVMSQTLSTRHITYSSDPVLDEPLFDKLSEPILDDPLFDKLDESEIHE